MSSGHVIKNFKALARTPQRRHILEILEAGLTAIQPERIIKSLFPPPSLQIKPSFHLSAKGGQLKIGKQKLNLSEFRKVFLIGFGKGAAALSWLLEKELGGFLSAGFVIDVTPPSKPFKLIKFTKGTHPLPSQININFTKKTIQSLSAGGECGAPLRAEDLALVVIAGGGSALFEWPASLGLKELLKVHQALLQSGMTIQEMNVVRKHLSRVKAGGLAKMLYPSRVISLIVSDVPGDDIATIASGPTAKDKSTVKDAIWLIKKYNLETHLPGLAKHLVVTPKDDRFFKEVGNIIVASNKLALRAMESRAKAMGLKVQLFARPLIGQAREAAQTILQKTKPSYVLIAGGETTVTVKGKGKGGRNQELVLAGLQHKLIKQGRAVLASINTDGFDNTLFAGAIGDKLTWQRANQLKLELQKFLAENNSFAFFRKTGDGIITGRLPSNVADIVVGMRY